MPWFRFVAALLFLIVGTVGESHAEKVVRVAIQTLPPSGGNPMIESAPIRNDINVIGMIRPSPVI